MVKSEDVSTIRKEYLSSLLEEESCSSDPLEQFRNWFEQAKASKVEEPNAMVLSTVSTVDGHARPSARAVLLKRFGPEGFLFFTNYNSPKAKNITLNPNVALTFLWSEIERQVRIQGVAATCSRSESEQYFQARPKGSQIAAICSPQSKIIPSRDALEQEVRNFNSSEIRCPESWGGYYVRPYYYEFWQGRENRLHDRIEYAIQNDGSWKRHRLAP